MSRLLSLGRDQSWRRFLVSCVHSGDGTAVLDVATGTGAVAIELARRGSRVVGVDQSQPMLRRGAAAVRASGVASHVRLVLAQAERLPFRDESFDAVTFTWLLRYVDDPAATLAELCRPLRPGGVLAGLEFHVPPNPMWRLGWVAYTRLVMPAIGALVSPAWSYTGRFLGRSISQFYVTYPLQHQVSMWKAAGLRDVRFRLLTLGGGVVMWGVKGRA